MENPDLFDNTCPDHVIFAHFESRMGMATNCLNVPSSETNGVLARVLVLVIRRG